MSDSEEEAYDPWPGCWYTRTGCHGAYYHHDTHKMTDAYYAFFGLSDKPYLSLSDADTLVLTYAESKHPIERSYLTYDEGLWKLFGVEPDKPIRLHHIPRHNRRFILYTQPEQSQPFIHTFYS